MLLARGLAAQILLGEPAVSRSEGPCGPSERYAGARAEAGGYAVATRGPGSAAEARRKPMGGAGSPPGWNTAGRASVQLSGCPRGCSRSAASCARLRAQAAAGGVAGHRTGATSERREEADGVTDRSLRRAGATCAAWLFHRTNINNGMAQIGRNTVSKMIAIAIPSFATSPDSFASRIIRAPFFRNS